MNWNDTLTRLIDLEDHWSEEARSSDVAGTAMMFAFVSDLSSLIDGMLDEDRHYPDEPREDVLNRMQWVEDSSAQLGEEGLG